LTEITPIDPLADYSCLAWRRLQAQMLDTRKSLTMQATWVVVADHRCATIYTVPRGMARLRQLCELRESRTPAGRAGGQKARIPDKAVTPGERPARSFAVQVALHVEDGRLGRHFDELILVAAPTFLADLRESLSQAARDVVIGEIPRNLNRAQRETLQEQVLRIL
jgi:protein required for attachment to host cells